MGLADRLRQLAKTARDSAAGHKDQLDQAIQKAATAADQRTGGKYRDQIAKAESTAETYVDNLKTPAPADHPAETPNETGETDGKTAG
jgi:DNA-binding protein H-NS